MRIDHFLGKDLARYGRSLIYLLAKLFGLLLRKTPRDIHVLGGSFVPQVLVRS